MDLNLRGRLALVTGSTHGLGKAIALALAQEGVEVIINGRHEKAVIKTMKEISDKYRVQTWACPVDVTDNDKINSFFELGPVAAIGKLDILVNNAGHLEKFGDFTDLSDEDWLSCYNLTFMSAVRFIRASLPYLTASKQGRIINISSLSSHQPGNFNPHYVSFKAALNILTKQLATKLGNANILVNAICPSTLDGGIWRQNVADRAQRSEITYEAAEHLMRYEEFQKSPLCRMGTLENVADLVVYLASDKANFQTGHIYDIDGGITRGL